MSDRSIRAGQSIKLRARFKDDLGDTTVASNVQVHIWEPEADTSNLGAAYVVSGVPVSLGEGIYEYEFITPDCGPQGFWHDHWEGELSCQDVTAEFLFFVAATGTVTQLDCQLNDNNLVQVFIPSGIQATDGTSLSEEYEFEFMTNTNPSYTNLRKVRLEVGGFITSLLDDTIQTAILEASLEADTLSFVSKNINSKLFLHARREYTTCMTGSILLSNLGNMQLKSKTLADLSVSYDTQGIVNQLGRLQDCLSKWAPQLMAGGGARASVSPSMVIKGAYDQDRPQIGRLWENTEGGSTRRMTPAGNAKLSEAGKRRSVKSYWPRNGGRWW